MVGCFDLNSVKLFLSTINFLLDFIAVVCYYTTCSWRSGGMVDASDSKSDEGNFMRVRVPPSLPGKNAVF